MSAENGLRTNAVRQLRTMKGKVDQNLAALRVRAARGDLVRLGLLFTTDKGWKHGYTTHYATHLGPRRRERLNVLEIGIGGGPKPRGGGGSLRMWQAYLPNSMIYGVDILEKVVPGPRIRVLQGDQSDAEFMNMVVDTMGTVDVVIDDGSHVNAHVRATFNVLFSRLAPRGLYVIEDLHTAYLARWGGFPPGTHTEETSIGLVKELVDGLHHRHFPLPDYVPTYTDEHVAAVHVYEKIAFIEKVGAL